jgi:hypothetical protein
MSSPWWRNSVVLWARRVRWTLIFIGGAYGLVESVGYLFVRSSVPAWLSALIALAALMAMSTAVLFLWIANAQPLTQDPLPG